MTRRAPSSSASQPARPAAPAPRSAQLRASVQRAEQPQQVGDALGVRGPAVLGAAAAARPRSADRLGVEQVAQLGLARAARPAGRGPATARRPGARPAGSRPRTGTARCSRTAATARTATAAASRPRRCAPAAPRRRASAARARHVEDVLQALADGLEHDREAPNSARHLQQLRGPLPLLPQRLCAGPGWRRGSSSARAAHSRNREANSAEPPSSVVTQVGSTSSRRRAPTRSADLGAPEPSGRSASSGQPQHDPVVGVHRLRVDAVPLAQPGAERERPRGVHLRAEGGVDARPASRPARRGTARRRSSGRPGRGRVASCCSRR